MEGINRPFVKIPEKRKLGFLLLLVPSFRSFVLCNINFVYVGMIFLIVGNPSFGKQNSGHRSCCFGCFLFVPNQINW